MGVNDVAASGFGAGADDYERGRPSYPADIVSWIVEQLDLRPGRSVVDLAAGTGKLTRLLVPSGAEVVAVEPVAAMREKLTETAPGASALDGTAESLPFESSSVDAVTVAQAFHWFDAEAALAEIGRVLRPGGGVVVVWNERDVREPWVAELSKLIRWDERAQWRVPYTLEVDWGARLGEIDSPFGPFERRDSSFRQQMDADLLVARVLSTSYLATLAPEARDDLAHRVRALVAPLGATFDLPYVTTAWSARRDA
jgi:SAM-dependent methyltransferase